MNNPPSNPMHDPGFNLGQTMDVGGAAPSPSPKFRLKKFIYFLKKFWWIPLILLIVFPTVAVVKFWLKPPEFDSTGSMWEPERLKLSQGADFSQNEDTFFGNLTQVLQGETLRQLTLAELSATGTNNIVTDKNGNPIPVQINVYLEPKSSVYAIQAISANPAYTPLYLNALMNAYLSYAKTVRKQVSGDTLASISALVTQKAEEMKSDQEALEQYEQTNNLVVLDQENQVAGSYLAKLNTQLADYQLQDRLLDAVALEKSSPVLLGTTNLSSSLYNQLLGENDGSSSPSSAIETTDEQIASLKFQRDKLSKYLRPGHPKIVQINEQIAEAQNLADNYRSQNQKDIATARQALKIRMDSVQQSIKEWEAKVDFDSARIAQADNLKANIARETPMYDNLVSLLQNVDLTRNIDQPTLAILEPATPSTRSYAQLKSSLSAAVFTGFGLGLGIILLLSIRDDRFTSVVEVSEKIGDGVVGQVPEIAGAGGKSSLALLENNDENHTYAESYRSLRSALLFFSVNGVRPKLILITSAVPNEGKSTVASNLALTLALGGARVLLVDADLRKGRLHEILEKPSNPGLSEYLLNLDNLEKYIQPTTLPNLWFIPRGRSHRSPGDLFLNPAFAATLVQVREQYDYVIVDSCPVFAADDATTLAPKVDGVLFVVRSNFSRSGVVREALELLSQRQANILGLILNRTNAKEKSYHYYKYSEYYASDETT